MHPQYPARAITKNGHTQQILLGYQQRWLTDPAPVKVMEKSRRIGITWAEAADCSLLAARSQGMDVWYIGYNREMAREFIEDCGRWLTRYQLAAERLSQIVLPYPDRNITAWRIRCASGHCITALSSRPTNLRGKQGKVVIDEAAFHPRLDLLLKAAMALIMWGGRVAIISTHNGENNPFNRLIGEIRAGKLPWSLHRVTLDQALEDGLYERICLSLGEKETTPSAEARARWRAELTERYGQDADEELFCIPRTRGASWLSAAVVSQCMEAEIPTLRFTCPPDFALMADDLRADQARRWCEQHLQPLLAALDSQRQQYFGQDFARSQDLSVMIPLIEQEDMRWRQAFVLELAGVPFKEQELICFYILDRLPRLVRANFDAAGNGQYLAETAMQRYGADRVGAIRPSEGWYRQEMPRLKSLLENRQLAIARHSEHLEDYCSLVLERGVARLPKTRVTGADGQRRHGDVVMAMALAVAATRHSAGEYTYFGFARRGHRG